MSDFIHEMRSPTLLIGVGGIGGHIVNEVNKKLSDFDRSKVKLLVMDTNVIDLSKFEGSNISYIQTSTNQTVEDYLRGNPEYLDWFPLNPFINSKNLIQGAGQIRSVSRLGGLSSKADGKFQLIDSAIRDILKTTGDPLIKAVRVMIVGSITGGTGSGLGIQLPFYIRKVFREEGVPNALIRGMFLMPSLTEDCQDTESKEKAVNVNGYAFLKELNALYKLQTVKSSNNNLKIEEYTPGLTDENDRKGISSSGMIPYDFLFLVERANAVGNLGGLSEYIERSAHIVISQLFTPIGDHGMSSEDNLIINTVAQSGMSRYCAAGLSKAIYPKDSIMRYCTVKYSQTMLAGYWLEIDRRFKIADKQNSILKKSNPNLVNLNKGKQYREIFDDLCDPQQNNVISELYAIHQDVIHTSVYDAEDGTTIKETTPIDTLICNNIDLYLDQTFQSNELNELKRSCELNATGKSSVNSVVRCIEESMSNLTDLKTKATERVNNLTISAIESILSSNVESAKAANSNSLHNIYSLLNNRHPIAVRYVLYGIIEKLKENKANIDSELSGLRAQDAKNSVFNKDYDPSTEKIVDSPTSSIRKIDLGWLKILSIYSDAYKSKVEDIKSDISNDASRILNIASKTYKSTVLSAVIERLEILIKIYEDFFDELENIKNLKADEADTLELGIGTGVNRELAGDRYICDAPIYRTHLYKEFEEKISGADFEMSDNVKTNFFDEIFTLYSVDLQLKNDPTLNITRKSLIDIFENGILKPICEQFKDTGYKHLDMSIIDAVYKQYSIITPNAPDRKSAEFIKYFNDLCTSLANLATPYLMFKKEVPGYNCGGKTSYAWGINAKALSGHQNGTATGDINQTNFKTLIGPSINYRDFVADDSYAPNELVCYATLYDLLIENCSSYVKGRKPEVLYSERLKNYANRENYLLTTDTDDVLNVIHPHLDKRWHEHAYLPELMGYDEDEMVANISLAYLLALALGKCVYSEDKVQHLSCWRYQYMQETSKVPIFVNQRELTEKSLYSLYEAFDRNRIIVDDILTSATIIRDNSKKQESIQGMSEEDILSHKIIDSLCNIKVKVLNNEENLGSVLDLIFSLYSITKNFTFAKDLISNLRDYLKKYALYMRNDAQHPANYTYKQILKKIGNNTKCAKDVEETPDDFLSEVADFIKADTEE